MRKDLLLLLVALLVSFSAAAAEDDYGAATCQARLEAWKSEELQRLPPVVQYGAAPPELNPLVFFLRTPGSDAFVHYHCLLKPTVAPKYRCRRDFVPEQFDPKNPSCELLASHDDYSVVGRLPPGAATVVSTLHDPVDRVIAAYEGAVELAAAELDMRQPPAAMWPWNVLVPLAKSDLVSRRKLGKRDGSTEGPSPGGGGDYSRPGVVMPLEQFIEHPTVQGLVLNGATLQVAGITANSSLKDAPYLRECIARNPSLGHFALDVAKARLERMPFVGISESDSEGAQVFATLVGRPLAARAAEKKERVHQFRDAAEPHTWDGVGLSSHYRHCERQQRRGREVFSENALRGLGNLKFGRRARSQVSSELWTKIQKLNPLDMELYNFGRLLFSRQKQAADAVREATLKSSSKLQHTGNATAPLCPWWFGYMHTDFAPWKDRGINLEDVEASHKDANYNFQIINGELYVKFVKACWETRKNATIWGMLMLLRRFPGQIPDIDGAFDCHDYPQHQYFPANETEKVPIMFVQSSTKWHRNIMWPDFSFWGRPEVGIRQWDEQRQVITAGADTWTWETADPVAYWKGNVKNGGWVQFSRGLRKEVVSCAQTDPRVGKVVKIENSASHLRQREEDRCRHRFGMYMEGNSWSVSRKYNLACGFPVIYFESPSMDFFSRGVQPWVHTLPVDREEPICWNLRHMLEWAVNHSSTVQEVGRRGRKFCEEDLKMENVYNYMYHILRYYGSLQRFKPERRPDFEHITIENLKDVDPKTGKFTSWYADNKLEEAATTPPCTLPPPQSPLRM